MINEGTSRIRRLRIELSEIEHQKVLDMAKEERCTLKTWTRKKLLDDVAGATQLSDQIMKLMPDFYNLVDEVGDKAIQKSLRDIGGAICRYLK